MRTVLYLGLLISSMALVGCGDGLRRVSVKGTAKAAGQLIDSASVQLLPEGSTKGEGALGRTDAKGQFTLIGSRHGHVGVVPGGYRVRLSRLVDKDGTPLPDEAADADYPGSYESIPAPFSTLESGLKIAVPETDGEVNIEIPAKLIRRKGSK